MKNIKIDDKHRFKNFFEKLQAYYTQSRFLKKIMPEQNLKERFVRDFKDKKKFYENNKNI